MINKISQTSFSGVYLIDVKKLGDDRGFFSEVYSPKLLKEIGFDGDLVQDNHAYSRDKGVLRGLHYQKPPHAQAKLIRVIRGAVLDVVVDLRKGSKTYGQSESMVLSRENWLQLFVPEGFAHGYLTLEKDTEVCYKVSCEYAPQFEAGVSWSDPSLGICWGLDGMKPKLSEKDKALPFLGDMESPFD